MEAATLKAEVRVLEKVVRQDKLHMFGIISCSEAGVSEAYLELDMATGEVVLIAACGCRVAFPLAHMVHKLGQGLQHGHGSVGEPQVH